MKKILALVTCSLFCSSSFAMTLDEAKQHLAMENELVSLESLSSVDAKAYSLALVGLIDSANDKQSVVNKLFSNNPELSNVVYQAAVAAGMAEDNLVAAALSLGIDPSEMLAPTAFAFAPPSIEDVAPPPPPPPAPAPPTGGGSGGGGVTISSN